MVVASPAKDIINGFSSARALPVAPHMPANTKKIRTNEELNLSVFIFASPLLFDELFSFVETISIY